jgi:hypothetical protein
MLLIIQVFNKHLSNAVISLVISKGWRGLSVDPVGMLGEDACLWIYDKYMGYDTITYAKSNYPNIPILSAKTDWDKIEAYFNEPKFEIGDRVKIVKNESRSNNQIGDVGTITQIDNHNSYRVTVNGRGEANYHKPSEFIHTTEPLTEPNATLKLNREYTAEIDKAKRIVKVGCSEFTFDKINELSEAIK